MKIDGALLVDNPADAGPLARTLESIGYHGGFTFEGRHDPFLPLSVAAAQTERLELITAIAIAFARNPMTLANMAYDLQLQSEGRFILGLGSQIRPHIERRFSSPWSRPAARMREFVLAMRAIWASWQEGEKLDFRGDFYTHTLMTPVFNPGPNPHGLPKVFLAGVGPKMTEVAGEVADGFFIHPFHTIDFIRQVTMPALEAGLKKSGRRLEDLEISCQAMIAAGDTDEELKVAMNGARAQVSFYASTPAYRGVLECHGMGDLQNELNEISKRGGWLEMAGRIPDELIERIAIVGSKECVAAELRARYGEFADRVSLISPFSAGPEAWSGVVRELSK